MSENGCSSCGSSGSCSSEHNGGCSPEDAKLNQTLSRIKHKIVVMSGKGGVGKSTVAANIAVALSLAGKKVGLMDVDVHGPTIPRMLSLGDQRPHLEETGMEPVPWSKNLSVISIGFLLPNPEQAVVWRGPVKMGVIRQFIQDVFWGDLDYLIVDCPPGTGDEPLSVLQLMPDAKAVVVTTPQAVAVDDVRRSVGFCRELKTEIVGIVENMSGFVCSHCGEVEQIFKAGGGEKLAQEMGVNFLGAIPLDPEMVRAGDEGFVFMKVNPESKTGEAIGRVVKPLLGLADALQEMVPQNSMERVDVPAGQAKRVAIPIANGKMCMHFGHCQQFAFVDVVDGKAATAELLTPPAHEPGVFPAWVAENGADLVIAGGMGARAQSLFTDQGVRVLTGAPAEAPEALVDAFLAGKLNVGANICDH